MRVYPVVSVELKSQVGSRNFNPLSSPPSLSAIINDLYVSRSFNQIARFYDYFHDSGDLSSWMHDRPKGNSEIVTFEGNVKDICVVVPTISSSSDFAKRILKETFRGLTVIFVESGRSNPFFNFSHNCNTGFREALERFDPEWIIYSNDDMVLLDQPDRLVQQLSVDEIRSKDFVFSGYPSRYHSYVSNFVRPNILNNLLNPFRDDEERTIRKVEERVQIEYLPVWTGNSSVLELLSHMILHRSLGKIINIGSFGIFNSKFVREVKGVVFDETFVNGLEDVDFSMRILRDKLNVGFIKYRIGDVVGGSSTKGEVRFLQLLANYAYFNRKYPIWNVQDIIGQAKKVYGFPLA